MAGTEGALPLRKVKTQWLPASCQPVTRTRHAGPVTCWYMTPPRVVAEGVKACRYRAWMGLSQPAGSEPCLLKHAGCTMRLDWHQTLMRFRLGVWGLEMNRRNGRCREQRTCRVCGDPHAVEDELHVFLECPCYERLRDEFRQALGFGSRSMLEIMTGGAPAAVAEYLHRLWGLRLEVLRRQERKRGAEGDRDEPRRARH